MKSKSVVFFSFFCVLAAGCADDDASPSGDPLCPDPYPERCNNVDETAGNDEVGDGDGDEGAEHRPCITQPGNGTRTMHQCNGHLTASIEFTALGKSCTELLGIGACSQDWEFGVGEDDYMMPAVMACCDADGTPEDELLTYCAADLVAQVCSSVPKRIQAMIEDGLSGVPALLKPAVKKQASNLVKYLSRNDTQQACFDTLHRQGSPGIIESQSWLVNGGGNDNWPSLHGFTVTLNKAVVQSTSLPDVEVDQLACESIEWNDGEVFEEPGPITPTLGIDFYRLRGSASVPIIGPSSPSTGLAMFSGSASVASQSVCHEPWCSELVMGEDSEGLMIQELALYSQGAVSIAAGDASLEVEGLAMRLYGFVQAQTLFGNDGESFIVDAGAAHFIVSGAIGDMAGDRWVSNVTPVRLYRSEDGWVLDTFIVERTDAMGVWQAVIPVTTWE